MVDKTCTGDPAECDPDTQTPHVPFAAGITGADPLQSSTLGISVYARPPSEQPTLLSDLATAQPGGKTRWAAVEWGLGMMWRPPGVAPHSPGDPDSFTRFRPYLAHFFPVFSRFLRVFTVSPRRFQRAPSRNPGPRNSVKGAQTPFRRPS